MATSRNAVIGLLRVLLSANTAEFDTAMRKSADSAKAWSRDLRQIGRQATEVGTALTKTLTLPILGVGVATAKLAMDFESSFAGVRKTVDATEPELAELAQGFRDLSKTIPVNVNDLNRLGEAAGALGIPKDKIVEFASVMAKLGVSTNLTADQAADSIARIQNIFGAAGKDTERLASTLVALGNAGASTEKEIVEMGQRIAGAGHTVGLTQAQVLAFASTLASVGINAEAGGSAISRVFLKINDAVQKGGSGLAEFARVAGMSSAQFKTAFETNAAGATQAFIEGLGRLKSQGENINATIEGLTGKNIILKDTLFRLAGAGGLLADQLKIADSAWQSNTALTKEASERFKTTESRLLLLGNRVKDVGITIGNALGPSIDLAIRGLNTLIPILERMANLFAALPPSMQGAIVALAGIVAAAGPVVYILGQLALSGSAIAATFSANGIATQALVGLRTSLLGIGGAATAITLPLTGLAAAFVGVRLATGSWSETLKVLAIPLYGTIGLIGELIDGLIPAEGVIADVASIIQNALIIGIRELSRRLENFLALVRLIPTVVGAVAKALTDQLSVAIQNVINLLGQALPSSMRLALVAIGSLPGLFDSTKKAIHGAALELERIANKGVTPATTASWSDLSNLLTGGFVPAVAGAAVGTSRHTGETKENTKALAENAKTLKVQQEALKETLDIWRNLGKVSAAGPGLTPLDPSRLYAPKDVFGDPRNDQLGPMGLDPSKIDMGAWAKGIPDSQRQSFWKGIFGSSEQFGQAMASTIMGAIQGGGNPIAAGAGLVGSSIGSSLAGMLKKDGTKMFTGALGGVFSAVLPVVGSLIGPLAGALWNKLFGTAGRDLVKDFAASLGGFDAPGGLHDQLLAVGDVGEAMWKRLTQQVGRNDQEGARAAIAAATALLEAHRQKQTETAQAAEDASTKQQEALDAIGAKYKTEIDKLESEWKSLADSVAKEAQEEHMGITETLERERMKQLEDQQRALELQRDAEIAAKKETFAETLAEGQQLDNDLRDMFERGYKIPMRFTFPDGMPGAISPSALSAGYDAGMMSDWDRRAPTTGGGQPIVIQNRITLDGKVVARNQVQHLPNAFENAGL